MFHPLTILEKILSHVGEGLLANRKRAVDVLRISFEGMTDDALKEECKLALEGNVGKSTLSVRRFLSERALSLVFGLKEQISPTSLRNVALAVEAFNRAPADLPAGSHLYPQQIRTAAALTQRYILQMDTGEGKTYALLPAAFALSCQHGHTYILCANDYLAWRDAKRTQKFWEFVGVDVGLGLKGKDDSEWDCPVVYTTLENLIFKALRDEISATAPAHPVLYGSVLLDDADATLLDSASQPHALVHPLPGDAFNWNGAIRLASTLVEKEHIEVDRNSMSASLTVGGEMMLRSSTKDELSPNDYLLLRTAVESAYLAKRVVQEGVDYAVEWQHIVPIDRITGRLQPNVTYSWMLPLEFERGLPTRPTNLTVHQISPATLLSEFKHVAGLSGTITGDATEYVFTYCLWTSTIPPRRPRHKGLKQDVVFKDRNSALKYLCNEVSKAVAARRPVFVGVQTINDAEAAAQAIQPLLSAGIKLRVLTGKNEREMAESFEAAGQSGSVLIATQLAGRGVDIRLSGEAKSRGGLALFGLGHAVERRHDLQFLGRAGRQGDPFTAQFICSLEDPLMRLFGSERISVIMQRMGLDEDQELEHPLLTKSIYAAQSKVREHGFLQRVNLLLTSQAEIQVRHSFKEWVDYVQSTSPSGEASPPADVCSDDFINFLLTRCVQMPLKTALAQRRDLNQAEAEEIANTLSETLGFDQTKTILRGRDIEGLSPDLAVKEVQLRLKQALMAEEGANEKFRTTLTQDLRTLSESHFQLFALKKRRSRIQSLVQTIEKQFAQTPAVVDSGVPPALESAGLPAPVAVQNPGESGTLEPAVPDSTHQTPEGVGVIPGSESPEINPAALDADRDLKRLNEELETAYTAEQLPAARDAANIVLSTHKDEIEALEKRISKLVKATPFSYKLTERTPRAVASWAFKWAWITFLADREKILHRARNATIGLDYSRFVSDRIIQRWTQIDANLAADILRALFKTGTPNQLDQLFFLEDHIAAAPLPESDQTGTLEWRTDGKHSNSPAINKNREENLIDQFIEESKTKLGERQFGGINVRRLLADFTRQAPIHSLQTSEQIMNAMNEAFSLELEHGVTRARARSNRECIRLFLIFLRERRLVGKLPTLNDWYQAGVRRVVHSLFDRSSVVFILSGTAFATFFLLLTHFGSFVRPVTLSGFGKLLDDLLCAGWLREGRITAPAMGILVIGLIVARLLAPWQQSNLRGMSYDKLLVPLLQVAFAAWVTWPHGRLTVPVALETVALFLAIFLVCWITQRFVWTFAATSGISFESAWLCLTIALVLLPNLLATADIGHEWQIIFGSVVVLSLIWKTLNSRELRLVSRLVSRSENLQSGETMIHTQKVLGDVGAGGHIFGVLIGWLACNIVKSEGLKPSVKLASFEAPALIAIGVYLAVVVLWNWLVLDKRLSPKLWSLQLNAKHQLLDGCSNESELARCLRRCKIVLLSREMVFHLALIGAAVAYAVHFGFISNGFPIAFLFLAATLLFANCFYDVGLDGYKHFLSRMPFTHRVLDIAILPEPKEDEEEWYERWKHFLQHRVGFTFVIISLLIEFGHIILKLLEEWRAPK